ncbi:chromosome segregation and condensation protein ScpA [Natronomonas moolapensis 8.8.11]|uniref:Chromosome segregation and condensation protein ScpA n=1 Tax=Natronomonas moolapensis (strain DSM 18674 / CECT 7526 / JCM 14361 / 8.8.11) TaxID=268739 RepID=M1XPC0_NATM8|nr:ScpA family protein [Natronomonas moolapensis]CCQ35863.1 chromosome segregation and condensation protein ScpA [Natronomonas moolapensis 8.8.11]
MTSEDERSESSIERAGSKEPTDSPHPPLRADGGTADEIPLNIAGHGAESPSEEDGGDGPDDAVPSGVDVSAPDGSDDEVEPVELLVQLAEDGEIDPWDIDVVTVTDKFLDRLDGSDLRTGGRALFYASVLLRMKSDVMWTDDEPDEGAAPDPEPWERPPGEEPRAFEADPIDELEREMDRRIERKRARGMPETLDELVRDLRERERDTWWKESRTYDTSGSPSGYGRGTRTLDYHAGDDVRMDDEPTAEEVTGKTHDEHMEEIVADVYRKLRTHYDRGREEVLFTEVRTAGGGVVDTFLGLLFLANRGQVRLRQDDLFGDLWIRDPAGGAVEESASADD